MGNDEEPEVIIVRGALDTSLRCDGCGAQAKWSTWVNLTELNWCNHHYVQGEARLRALSSLIISRVWDEEDQ